MNTTMTLFLRSGPAMYTSPGRTYARVGVRDPAHVYVRGRILFLAPWPLYVRVHATCAPLLRHVRASTTTRARLYIHQYICTYTFATRMTTLLRFDQVGPDCQALPCLRRCSWWVPAVRGQIVFCPDALPCVRRCSWWVPAVRGKRFFHEIRWPVRWVPAVRWRNNYFPRNKEPLPSGCHGPSCQPLHVQYSSDGSRSLTTLTTPRREHEGGGRRRGQGRGRRGAGEDATVDAHAERSTRVHWFGCGVRLPSPQNNRGCG